MINGSTVWSVQGCTDLCNDFYDMQFFSAMLIDGSLTESRVKP